ncbi:MAG TPA: calcium-binding protein [Capillimicrobium sp.]|jgi:Ca2+-binding RTX toxin-like protein
MRTSRLLPAAALAALALVPAAADASTVTREGDTYVFAADRAAEIQVTGYDYVDDRIVFFSSGEPVTAFPDGCGRESWDDPDTVRCPQGFARVRVEGGAGDDDITVSDEAIGDFTATVNGNGGNDTIRGRDHGATERDRYTGGDGDDTLTGGSAPEVLEGGAGLDTLHGNEGADEVRGGEGDDELTGDSYSRAYADVVDGGPGTDSSTSDWTANSTVGPKQQHVTVTLDGKADDGRPGEGDNVTSIETIVWNSAATFVAGAEPVDIALKEVPSGSSKLVGSDGADRLRTPDSNDTIDGRGGDDELEGGNGDDRITGGPGKDTILGDAGSGSCNFLVCRLPQGNDTIRARDGARDSVDCGAGEDVVIADRKDRVASTCERVKRR